MKSDRPFRTSLRKTSPRKRRLFLIWMGLGSLVLIGVFVWSLWLTLR